MFVAIGHVPNTAQFAPPLDVDANGYFVVADGSQVLTKVPGVYVAGDCAYHVYRQAIAAAGMGCQAAIKAERWLAEHGVAKCTLLIKSVSDIKVGSTAAARLPVGHQRQAPKISQSSLLESADRRYGC